jgi:4-alpha-glucanotransferase
MTISLAEVADRCGIESSYISETGERRVISDEVKRGLIDAMELGEGVAIAAAAPDVGTIQPCFIPEWLQQGRAWGVSLQLYGVRSARNFGIGDLEDLAQLAELLAGWGADFIGVNPLHALFSADPEQASPYSPSSRQYLNPIYIAVDRVIRADDAGKWRTAVARLRKTEMVDYAGVAALKSAVLHEIFSRRAGGAEFDAYCAAEGEALHSFAVFEALSEHFAAEGRGPGWHGWPEEFHDIRSPKVAMFAKTHAERVRYHKWLQWIAARQLAEVQQRALAAGMRIGVYLDLAVGVSPDGAAAWADQALFAPRARIGAPPDMFNHLGQDWGLAPMKPANLVARRFEPFERELQAAMRSAGAVRLDHVMSLARLYWLPAGTDARSGGYVRYPIDDLLSVLDRCSQETKCVVIGEDLGTVPPGFRDIMRDHNVLSYRVFYFERGHEGRFNSAEHYPAQALACIATHDLPPLRGWWEGRDIAARVACNMYEHADAAQGAYNERAHARWRMLEVLRDSGAFDGGDVPGSSDGALNEDLFIAAHRYLARTPCRLFAVQLEDVAGAADMVNLPGTDRQHANWRRKLPVPLEELPNLETLRRTIEAVSRERPRQP